jgi:glucosyl-3-phosphoglycerate synthase
VIASFHHSEFPLERLLARKSETVTCVLPAREEEATVGPIVGTLRALGGLVDQVVVIDADSRDGTAAAARAAGAEVYSQSELVPEAGPVRGKGDAMWRALAVVRGELVVYLDADTIDFPAHFASGLLGPLIERPETAFVKAAFARPFLGAGGERPNEGGRVTALCARPLLAAFYPPLADVVQPLAGEVAARRSVLESLPFATGYAVEIGMLIDVYEQHGAGALAQVDVGERRNAHQSLSALTSMAYTQVAAVARRLRRDGRLDELELRPFRAADGRLVEAETVERPPFASLHPVAGDGRR